MFTLAVVIGIYSYALAALGWMGMLSWGWIWGVTFGLLVISLWFVRPKKIAVGQIGHVGLMGLIIAQAIVNIIGALGPERGFDALWYHLPIPKIWLEAHRIFFIGGNLYYSAMPKLIDMLYMWGATPAKLMHFAFGLLSTAVTYKLARKWLDEKWAMLSAVIFYSNLVVGWQSITAYIDLGRTFFEVLALLAFCEWLNGRMVKWLRISGVMLGLALATKILAWGSVLIFVILILINHKAIKLLINFLVPVLLVAAPWYLFSFVSTGNPMYPVFSGYKLEWDWTFNILRLADPINPIYVMILPVAWMVRRKIPVTVTAYCLLTFVVWYLTPRTGGGRFLLPYLPVWSVAVAIVIKKLRDEEIKKFLIGIIIVLAVISIGYRAVANLIR